MFGLHLAKGVRADLFEPNEWDFLLGNVVA